MGKSTPRTSADTKKTTSVEGNKIPDLFEQKDLKIIYNCLNGKEDSCIHSRDISTNKIQCALEKTFNHNTSTINKKLKAIEKAKLGNENGEFLPEEELSIRSEIVDRMKETLSAAGFHK